MKKIEKEAKAIVTDIRKRVASGELPTSTVTNVIKGKANPKRWHVYFHYNGESTLVFAGSYTKAIAVSDAVKKIRTALI